MKPKGTKPMALALAAVLALSVALAPAALAAETDGQTETVAEAEGRQKGMGRGGRYGGHSAAEDAAETGVGKDAAEEAALADAGLTADQVEKVRARYSEKDGAGVYRVFFRCGDTAYSYKIDAETGTVLDKQTGSAEDFQRQGHGKGGRQDAGDENGIGRQAAKDAALADAGLTSDQVSKVKTRYLSEDDGAYYRVSFRYDGQKVSYKIDAATGAVLDHSAEATDA